MEHSPCYPFFTNQYGDGTGTFTKDRLKKAVVKIYITADEYLEICGEAYTA